MLDVLVARVLGAFELERGVRNGEVVARALAEFMDDAVARRPVGLVPLLNGVGAPGTMGAMAVSFLGVIAALAMYAVSVAPSLMARSWAWHAVASGVLVSCGYVAGVVVQNVGARVIAVTGLTIRASEPV